MFITCKMLSVMTFVGYCPPPSSIFLEIFLAVFPCLLPQTKAESIYFFSKLDIN